MCNQKVRDAKIHVSPGKYTIVGLNRNFNNQQKMMNKVDMSLHHSEVDQIYLDL